MDSLTSLTSFVRTAETLSFVQAAAAGHICLGGG